MLLPERKRARRAATAAVSTPSRAPARAAALLLALLVPLSALASVNSARKEYKAGRFESALREYEKLLREKPLDARLHYNAGTAAFQAKDYQKAQQHFSAACGGQDTNLQQRAYYNLGNAQFRAGEAEANIPERQKIWEQSLKSYESAVGLNEKDEDAIYNRDLVRKKLEELKQQQQQQQQQQNKDQQEKKDDQQQQKDQQQKEEQQKNEQQQQQKQEDQQSQKQPEQKQGDEEQKQPEQKPGEEKDKQQESKPQESKQQQQKPGEKNEKGDPSDDAAQVGQQRLIQMTPEQAQRLLDAAKGDERVMIFTPKGRTNRSNRVLKDW